MELICSDRHMCIIRGTHNKRGHATGLWRQAGPLCHSFGSTRVPWAGTEGLDNLGVPLCYYLTTFFKETDFQTSPSNGNVAIKRYEILGVLA